MRGVARPQLVLALLPILAAGCAPAPGDEGASEGETEAGETRFEEGFGDGDGDTGDGDGDGDTGESEGCARLEQLLTQLEAEPDPEADIALVDDFLLETLYSEHGLPLVDDQRLCVVYLGDPAPIRVAGDFNEWDPVEHPLSEAIPGFGYAIVELDQAPAGYYKLVHAGVDYFADPLARRFGWDMFGEYSQVDAIPGRSHHERWPLFGRAPEHGAGELEPRTLTVWLPPAAQSEAELPVLYMHDGQNLFAPDALFGGWQVGATLDAALEGALLDPLIVVGVDNTPARMDEYTHVGDVIQGMPVGGRADEYAALLTAGVMPFIESRYPVSTAPADTGVMGSSLGGLVSLYIGLSAPERFGYVASMSGTLSWGTLGADNPTMLDLYLDAPPLGLPIYLDSGGGPGLGCPDEGADNYCANVEFADALRDLGWVDEQDLIYRWAPDAPHNEAAWAARLLDALLSWSP